MKINIDYIDSELILDQEKVLSIEISNNRFLYRLVNDLNAISNGELVNSVSFFENDKEINLSNKIKLVINYFDFGFEERKTTTDLNKYILENLDQPSKEKLLTDYMKMAKHFSVFVNSLDLPINTIEDNQINDIIKIIKYKLKVSDSLIENLFLLIDIEKITKSNKILVLVNSKLYLSKDEIKELCKYAIYNSVNLVLIDIISNYECTKYEKRIIIDENLDEFVVL